MTVSKIIQKLGQSLGKKNIDAIELNANEQNIKKLYFNVSRVSPDTTSKNVLYHQFYHAYLDLYQAAYEVP